MRKNARLLWAGKVVMEKLPRNGKDIEVPTKTLVAGVTTGSPTDIEPPMNPFAAGSATGYSRGRKTSADRRAEALERQGRYSALTPEQRLAALDVRLGVGIGAQRERKRLLSLMRRKTKPAAAPARVSVSSKVQDGKILGGATKRRRRQVK